MAGKPWTEQCKIDARAQIERRKEEVGEAKKAMMELAGESGIPFGTLNRWYYQKDDEGPYPIDGVSQTSKNSAKVKAKVINKIVENITMATPQGNREGAQALADELGGAVLAEELYELFLKKTTELDRIIRANSELDDPMDASKVIEQLLRMARNVGWEEYKPPAGLCEKCRI